VSAAVTPAPPLDLAPPLCCALPAAVGSEDSNPSPDLAEQPRERERSGQPVKVDVYEGAGHAFFADYRSPYRPEPAARSMREEDTWNASGGP